MAMLNNQMVSITIVNHSNNYNCGDDAPRLVPACSRKSFPHGTHWIGTCCASVATSRRSSFTWELQMISPGTKGLSWKNGNLSWKNDETWEFHGFQQRKLRSKQLQVVI